MTIKPKIIKKTSLLFLFAALFLTSCGSAPKVKQGEGQSKVAQSSPAEVARYRLLTICCDYFAKHPEIMNNQMTRKKGALTIQKMAIDSMKSKPIIFFALPFKYATAIKKGNKYIVKFSCSRYSTVSSTTPWAEISADLFAVVSEEIMTLLKDDASYCIRGDLKGSVNNKITLPSGATFYSNPSIREEFSRFSINLGGLYIENLSFDKVN